MYRTKETDRTSEMKQKTVDRLKEPEARPAADFKIKGGKYHVIS